MANGEETRGQVARAMEGAGGVEIKATIPPHQVDAAMKLYALELDQNERYVYFFDSPDLEVSSKESSRGPAVSSAVLMIAPSSSGRSTLQASHRSGSSTEGSRSRQTPPTRAW